MKPRWIKEGAVYSQVQRTVDRTYLLKPDPVIRNIIGASAARAQRKHPVKLYWLDTNINHEQSGIGPIDGTQMGLSNVALFKQTFHRIAAEEINRHLDREGPIFSTASRDGECVDTESVQAQFEYALTNPVKDGLVEKVSHWKGFSSYPQLSQGKDEVFTWFDRTAWHREKKGNRCRPTGNPAGFNHSKRFQGGEMGDSGNYPRSHYPMAHMAPFIFLFRCAHPPLIGITKVLTEYADSVV